MNLIEMTDLEFAYRDGEKVLQINQWSMKNGEKIFLFGASGSGKTTFLEILAGVLRPQQGSLRILGQEISLMSASARDQFRAQHLGYIFQSFNLIPYLSVLENIALPCRLSPVRRARLGAQSMEEIIYLLCERLGILSLTGKKVNELSVGQQQRVAVARALLGRPDLILADEPTSALDQAHREKFLHLLFELCEQFGSGLIFVSHDRTLENLFSRALSLGEINGGRK